MIFSGPDSGLWAGTMDSLRRLEQELKKCVKCGACRAHCPAFSVMGREPVSARGKDSLARALLNGDIALDARTQAVMSSCLLCGRCVEKCANDVPTDLVVLAVREALARKRGMTSFHRLVGHVLRNRRLMNWGAMLAAAFSPLLFRRLPASSGLRLRFPLPFLGGLRRVPALAGQPFLQRHPEVIPGLPGKPRVAYFVGCMTNYLYPEIAEAALTLLKSLGCTIILPKDQHCCGFPALSGGDLATMRTLAERNLTALERHKPDHVMTACASCGTALENLYPKILGERFPQLAERCSALAAKTIDAAVLLQQLGLRFAVNAMAPAVTITYHDPCHLRGRGITRQPRELLQAAPGVQLREMAGADACCGLGGTFNVYHYAASMQINSKKIAAITAAGASTVVTGCPGCMLQLADGLHQHGAATRVAHTLEILAARLQGSGGSLPPQRR
jgi:glycolate oxidase iron-sulfur subunit